MHGEHPSLRALTDCGGVGQGGRPESPELLGEEGAYRLLDEIRKGGVVDTSHQSLVLQLMVVCPEDVCKVRVRATSHRPSTQQNQIAFDTHLTSFPLSPLLSP